MIKNNKKLSLNDIMKESMKFSLESRAKYDEIIAKINFADDKKRYKPTKKTSSEVIKEHSS